MCKILGSTGSEYNSTVFLDVILHSLVNGYCFGGVHMYLLGHMAQLVEALRYKPKSPAFDS